ncbi:MMPL family transporter [Mesoterricola sediminis]|uniref:Membrane protein n=1 Tax=Mesoterricola sediminis TaxID=2927980 RepID=A0AA48KC33_9BACT|nr:MMPL family transporter [Mesoterricola sediminis]BDU75680.1 membrane protein [Mesoterricola sediminis]
MRARGWIWAALLAALATFAGLRLASGRALETDLLAMLPETEKNPVAEQALQSLARATQERVILLVKGPGDEAGKAAALHLARGLEASGAFRDVQSTLPPIDPGDLVRFYAPYRFRLASGALAGPDPAAALEAQLASPRFSGLPPELDPLGGFAGFLGSLPFQSTGLELRDNLLTVRAADGLHILVTAGLSGSGFDPQVQTRALGAVETALGATRAAFPGTEVLRTGVAFYAADARQTAEREMNLISALSILAIIALYVAVFRSVRHLALGLACATAGLVSALAVSLLLFGRLHLLTLVCGVSVLGVSVDYAFLYFAHHLGAGDAWRPREALARLRPPLLGGFATTILGYGALLAAPFPGLRQIAVFSMVGLAGAFLTVFLALPDWLEAPMPPRPSLLDPLARLHARVRTLALRPWALPGAFALAALLAAVACLGHTDDQVRGLIQPSAALRRDEARLSELMRISSAGAFFLVEGADEGQVLAREEALRARLPIEGVEGLMAVSAFVPSPAVQAAHLARNRELRPALARAMAQVGFRPDAVARGLDGLETPVLQPATFLAQPFAAPVRMLWLGQTRHGHASIVLPTGTPTSGALRRAAAGLPGVALVDKAQSVSDLMGHYRRLATWALGGAVLLVGLALGAWYGPRWALRLLLPAVLGILAALAAGALLGFPVSLFTLMALILALGFGVDYALFLRAGGPSALLGVALAGASTLISYGLLGLSHTPALRSFGVLLGVAVTVTLLTCHLALAQRETA